MARSTDLNGKFCPSLFAERGQRFGRGVVVEPEVRIVMPSAPKGTRGAELICDCGTAYRSTLSMLFQGRARSCGCLREESKRASSRTHGLSGHPLYDTHVGMMARCYDQGHRLFRAYGGRGIDVYPEWHDVTAFLGWIEANLGARPAGLSLDRVNNDLGYIPGNLRWATDEEQHRNTQAALKDRCAADHLFDDANTYLDKRGWRQCRTCGRERARQRRQQRNGEDDPRPEADGEEAATGEADAA